MSAPAAGHNSGARKVPDEEIKSGGVAVDRLRSLVERIERLEVERKALGSDIKDMYAEAKSGGLSLVERIERLEVERKALGSDIKDMYAEAKSGGFDPKVLRQLISIR
jgi:uncharacterized protein (UPF0335 family)